MFDIGTLAVVTFGQLPSTTEPFTEGADPVTLDSGEEMSSAGEDKNQRRGARTKAVLPVRIKGKDSSGKAFEELAHTLDVNACGARLGSVRRELKVHDEVTILYRQRRMQFRVMWTKKMQGTTEFQIGLQALSQDREMWGVSLAGGQAAPAPRPVVSQATGVA